MQSLEQKFDVESVYFCVNRTKWLVTPYLLNTDFTSFINLYSNEIIQNNKKFPFKLSKNSPIITHNFLSVLNNSYDNISIHRLWYLMKHTKYLSGISLIKKSRLKKIIKNGEISFRDIIEVGEIINHSKALIKEYKKENVVRLKENTL